VGGDQVEGRQAVLALLAAGRRRVRELWVAAEAEPSAQLDAIERWAARRHVAVQRVARRRLEAAARTDAPQGVLAYAEPIEPVSLGDLVRTPGGAPPLLVVLDGVTDPHNLGSVLRSSLCAGATGLVLPRHRSVRVTATVAKVAAGAVEHLPIALVPGVPAALAQLAELEVPAVGLAAEARTSLYDLGPVALGPLALVLGSEDRGLSQLVRRRCAEVVAIPQRGPVGSLNVAMAAAVALFELGRRRQPEPSRLTGG
jgi:23S rRNA (guanosine2251-2'-O)-methyltransferase